MEILISLIGFGLLVWFFLHTDMDFIRWRVDNIRKSKKETERIKEQSKTFLKDIREYNLAQKKLSKKSQPTRKNGRKTTKKGIKKINH